MKMACVSEELKNKITQWKTWDKNEDTLKLLDDLIKAEDYVQLSKVLCKRMPFGTAGLRGRMGMGYACMNDLVIIQTTQGFAKYLLSQDNDVKTKGMVIGFDGRHNSHRFAKLTANVFLLNGIKVYLFDRLCPTPLVPFTVVELGTSGGIMVTASHNPKEDNGYKVYWGNGPQIIPPHDSGIQSCIEQNLEPMDGVWDIKETLSNQLLSNPLDSMLKKYYTRLQKSMINMEMNAKSPINFTLTSMHGVSHEYMVDAFRYCNFRPFFPVKEQMDPDPEFPTVRFPNPEEGESALDLAFKTANETNSTIILANDPDADRLAVCEKHPETGWRVFTGNEIGGLLGWWSWERSKILNPDINADDCYMVASTVSSKFLRAVAKLEGFHFEETLTGFKWMGNRACDLMGEGKNVLFAFEEAIGFMNGTEVLDKDGVSAAIRLAELATYLQTKNIQLTKQLDLLYEKYGVHICKNSYYLCYEPEVIDRIFNRIRKVENDSYPSTVGRFSVSSVRDLTTGYDSNQEDKKAILPVSASSHMITFTFSNGCVLTLRTSGTEPKIKYYSEICSVPGQLDKQKVSKELDELVDAVIENLLQPEANGLISKS